MQGALVGCGYVSQFHLRAWRQVAGVQMVALCDLERARTAERAAEFSIDRTYTDVVRMLDEVHPHFLDIATRPESHLSFIKEAAARGIHILCQKPVAQSLGELEEMIQVCERASVRLCVNENWRWRPWHREMRRLVASGAIGRPYFLRFIGRSPGPFQTEGLGPQPYFTEMPRLIIYETGIHLIDTARGYLGDVTRVFARTRRVTPGLAGEDLAVVVLEFADEALALIDLNWASGSASRQQRREGYPFCVEGTEGVIELGPKATIRVTRPGETMREHPYHLPEDPYLDSYRACQAGFIHCLHSGESFPSGARENYNTMAAVFAAYDSAESGTTVSVPAGPSL